MRHRILILFLFISLIFSGTQNKVSAQNLTIIKELDFGEAVVTNNAAQYSINIQSNGSFLCR